VVTSPFKPSSVKPDKPLTIKNSISLLPPTYTYTFAKAGTYEVTFVAKNVDYTGEKEVVKSFEVQVKEKAKQTP
jgi:PKD repeat protein